MNQNLRELVSRGDIAYNPLGRHWADGLFTGNGTTSALLYGMRGWEWVINHNEVFQGFAKEGEYMKHEEVRRLFDSGKEVNSHFMQDVEPDNSELDQFHTVTPAVLRMRSYEAYGWSTPTLPALSGRVSIHDATIHAEMADDYRPASAMAFTPYGTNAFCLRLNNPRKLTFLWELARPEDYGMEELPVFSVDKNEIAFTQKFEKEDEAFAVVLKLMPASGKTCHIHQQKGAHIGVQVGGDTDAYVVVRTSRSCKNPLAEAIAEARELAGKGFDALYAEHAAWWNEYWEKSHFHLDTIPLIEKKALFAQYTMACTFAKGPMASLSGMAYGPENGYYPGCHVPWYTHDQNVQIAMMAAMPTNHPEIVNAMAETYYLCLDQMKKDTRELFGCDGVCLPLCMMPTGKICFGGEYRYTHCGSAYTGMILVMAWRYGRNVDQLKFFYPLLKEFIRFYIGTMRKNEAGAYYLDWMIPPEIFTMTRDDTCTLALLKPCIETAIEASELFHEDEEEAEIWRDVLANYPTMVKRKDGAWWCGPDIPEEHYMFGGHLFYPFFPSEADTDPVAAQKTVEYSLRMAQERNGLSNPECGWSCFNTNVARLRLGGQEALDGIFEFIRLYAKENGLFHHNAIDTVKQCALSPDAKRLVAPVIEGTSATLFMTAEMLLQNRNGVITLFPNVPPYFTGGFKGLLANGGFEVSAEMKGRQVVSCSVRAKADSTLRILDPKTGSIIERSMKAGETCEPLA